MRGGSVDMSRDKRTRVSEECNYEGVTYNSLFILIPESCWLFLNKLFFKSFFFLRIKWQQYIHTVLREWYFLLQWNNKVVVVVVVVCQLNGPLAA